MRDLRPLAAAAVVAVMAGGLWTAAVAGGWLGPDVDRGATFCEAAGGWVRQPANTFSNLGFVVAGLVIAFQAGRPAGMPTSAATAYACLVVLLGPASAAMHATESAAGGHLDQLSMYLLAGFAAAYALMRWLRRGPAFGAAVFAAAVVVSDVAGSTAGEVAVVDNAGNVAFAVLLLATAVIETIRSRRDGLRLAWGVAAVMTMLVAFTIWVPSRQRWCDPHSLLQGHAAWHLLCAVAAYLLYRFWASEPTGSTST